MLLWSTLQLCRTSLSKFIDIGILIWLLLSMNKTQQTLQRRFNVVFMLYDVATLHNVKSTLKQRCVCQLWNLQRRTTLKQRCVFPRWTEQRWTTSKQCCKYDHLKQIYKHWFKNKIIFLNFKEYLGLNIFLDFFPILTLSWWRPLSYRNQSI